MNHQGTKRLETGRLILRRFSMEDAVDAYENWTHDDAVTEFLTWPTHQNIETTESIIEKWEDESLAPNVYQWAIELKEINQVIGSISAVHIFDELEAIELGYCIGKKFWGKGIMTEAVREVMRFFFEEVGANRVCARCDAKNPASAKVMEKSGMEYEGTLRAADKNNTGICDCIYYGKVMKSAALLRVEAEYQEIEAEETPTGAVATKVDGKNVISDEVIEYVGILAKLELNDEEKEQAKKDIGEMLDYIDKLGELDTTGVEPMSHVFPVNNVFRQDVVTNGDGSEATLANAPMKKDGGFKVPKTIGE